MDTFDTNNHQGKTIKLRMPTLNRINALKHKGQSYDGFITELLDFHENETINDEGIRSSKTVGSRNGGSQMHP